MKLAGEASEATSSRQEGSEEMGDTWPKVQVILRAPRPRNAEKQLGSQRSYVEELPTNR
jgi:hypothetical protein